MNQRIIYSNSDGTIAIIVPADECGLSIEEIAAKDVPAGTPYEIVGTDDIPSTRTFRNAWVLGDGHVDHDLPRCKEIAHERRRVARAAEFAPYDDIIAKRIPGADAAAAEVARQGIRDRYAEMQATIDDAATADELLEVTP
jgi:hypothetical protein